MKKSLISLIATLCTFSHASAEIINVSDNIESNTSWISSNTYVLKDYIFVEPNSTFTIQAGTTIKADLGSGESAPALVVTRGAKSMPLALHQTQSYSLQSPILVQTSPKTIRDFGVD